MTNENNNLELIMLQGSKEKTLARFELRRSFFNLWMNSVEGKIRRYLKKILKKTYSEDIMQLLKEAESIIVYVYEIDAKPKHYIVIRKGEVQRTIPVSLKQEQIFFFMSMFAPEDVQEEEKDEV